MSNSIWLRGPLLGLGFVAALGLAGCGGKDDKKSSKEDQKPPTVVVATVQDKDLSETDTYTGRVEAINTVNLMARITGWLDKREFKQGSHVKKGDLLFQIEQAPYQIALAQAKADLETAEASKLLAEQTYARYKTLRERNVSSEARLDQATADLDKSRAAVDAAKSRIAQAELDLKYTEVRAPMDGLIGRAAYSPGAFIGPQSGTLATLVQQDPIYVNFPVPQAKMLLVRREMKNKDSYFAQIIMSDGTTYDHKGEISFAAVQTTTATDSVLIRATFPNTQNYLSDRQVVDVRIVSKKKDPKIVAPQSALLMDQQGPYVLAVDAQDKVSIKRITLGEQIGSLMVIQKGLNTGTKVIVSGHQKAKPGSKVSPQSSDDEKSKDASGKSKSGGEGDSQSSSGGSDGAGNSGKSNSQGSGSSGANAGGEKN